VIEIQDDANEGEEDDIQEQEVEKLLDILQGREDFEEEEFEFIDDEGNKVEDSSIAKQNKIKGLIEEDEEMNDDEY